jgi:hypothetical protein
MVMIEGKNGYPVDITEIDLELRDKMVSHIQKAIIHNLEAIKKLLQITGYEDICAGVHIPMQLRNMERSFFEDLFSFSSNNNKIKFQYEKKGNTGFRNHYKKFDIALDVLPDTCRILSKGGFTDTGFTSGEFTKDLIAGFEARTAVFFADFND